MKITYYGTGGGGGIPELFCSCRVCEYARKHKGRELRTRPLAVIDEKLCIDLPGEARSCFLEYGFDARKLQYLVITHNHYDHFMADNLLSRPEHRGETCIELYISQLSGETIIGKTQRWNATVTPEGLRPVCVPNIHVVSAFNPCDAGEYHLIPLTANHDAKVESLNYVISSKGKNLLWLHDSGVLLPETKDYLKNNPIYFDLISMDCAVEKGHTFKDGHMDIDQNAETLTYLKSIGCANDATRVILSHISHNTNTTHEELTEMSRAYGFEVAWDGMTIEI